MQFTNVMSHFAVPVDVSLPDLPGGKGADESNPSGNRGGAAGAVTGGGSGGSLAGEGDAVPPAAPTLSMKVST